MRCASVVVGGEGVVAVGWGGGLVFAERKTEKLTWLRNTDTTVRLSRTERAMIHKYIINNQ